MISFRGGLFLPWEGAREACLLRNKMVPEISEDLRRFVEVHVQSLEQLEILCLLRESPEELSVRTIYQRILTNEHSISQRLKNFVRDRLVIEENDRYRLSSKYHTLVANLADAYNQRRTAIIDLIYGKGAPSSALDFSEAFRLRKKE